MILDIKLYYFIIIKIYHITNKLISIKWGLGIGDNPQSPIPNPQSPISFIFSIHLIISYIL